MKRSIILLYIIVSATLLYAQTPGWAQKAARSVFTLKTFAADGSLAGSSNGFFVGENGEAVSNFAPFRGASRAVVIDAMGKEYPVECMLGANDIYDVAKFRVAAGKTVPLPLAATPLAKGSRVWLLPYSVKKAPQVQQGTVEQAERFQEQYTYYTIALSAQETTVSCPFLNQAGEVVGLMQQPAKDASATSYAVSARFAANQKISGLSLNDATLKSTAIPKDLPNSQDEALLALYVAGSSLTPEEYTDFLNRFVRKFPTTADGYIYRARWQASKGTFDAAEQDMQQAIRTADKKDDAHYQFASLIYQKEMLQADMPYTPWSLERALSESQEAYRLNPQPIYQQQQAQILYAQQKYTEALALYTQLMSGPLRSAELFYAGSQCYQQLGQQEQALALLDSAISTFSRPYLRQVAPYLYVRAQALYDAGKYRPAVSDYNEYGQLMVGQLSDEFYYRRAQAELRGHLYQQALDDIQQAIDLAPSNAVYYAEKASLQLRVGMTDEALLAAEACVRLDDQLSEGHLLIGIAQCTKGKKAEGLVHLQKAKELGNNQAQSFIDKYSK